MYKFKALDNTPPSQFCLGSVSKIFENDELKETALIGNVYDFSIEYRVIQATDILHIHDYLIKIHLIKLYLGRWQICICIRFSKTIINFKKHKMHIIE